MKFKILLMLSIPTLSWGLWALGFDFKSVAFLGGKVYTTGSEGGGGGGEEGGDIIPSSNRVDWLSVAGVEGGITYRSTVYTNFSPGATLANIQLGIDNCPSNQVVKLAAGSYTLSGQLEMKSYVTLRGAGPSTILNTDAQVNFSDGGGKVNVNLNANAARGATSVSLSSAPSFLDVGSTILINELNDIAFVSPCGWELPEASCETYLDEPDGGTRIRGQLVRVTSISGSTVNFTPALHWPFDLSLTPRIHYPVVLDVWNVERHAGIEDLTITNSTSTMIRFEQAQNCWLSNVTFRIATADTPTVQGFWSHRIEVVRCDFYGYTGTSSAIVPYVNNEGWKVENNIFSRVNQSFIVVGRGGGHAFLYNYTESVTNLTTAMIGEIGNHGGHPQFVLVEGNKLWKFHNDSIHGSSSHWTLFRNLISGRKPGSTFGYGMVWMDHTNWHNSVVGNILGFSSITTNDVGFTLEYESDGTDTADNNPDGITEFAFGRSGYNNHTIDTKAKSTCLRHGNYSYLSLATNWDAGIAERDIPMSMFYTNKPSFFGGLAWPPIGIDTNGRYTNEIPAEYRYLNAGAEPPAP